MKKVLSYMVIALMLFTGVVLPVKAYTNVEWNTEGFGSLTEVSENIVNLKGNETATDGQFYGPYAKPTVEFGADKSIMEEFNIELVKDNYTNGEFFDLSVSLDDENHNYVTEFRTMTQKVGDKFVITSSLDNEWQTEIDQDGVYTYRYEAALKDGKIMAKVTLLFYGEEIAATDEIDLDSISAEANKPVAEKVTSVRSFWFDSIYAAKGVNVYDKLPTVKVTLKYGEVEEVIDYPLGYGMTEAEIEELKQVLTDELAAEGIVFNGFYKDEELTEEFDWSQPLNEDTVVYLSFDVTENREEDKTNPDTSDINLIFILGTLLIGGAGLGFTLKNRKFN